MAFPAKFRHLLELTADDLDMPDYLWLTYAVCAVTMVTYHLFAKATDTAYLKRTALAAFDELRPHFTNGWPPWIVLRAADRTG